MKQTLRIQAEAPFEKADIRMNQQRTVLRCRTDDRSYLLPRNEPGQIAQQWDDAHAVYRRWSTLNYIRGLSTFILVAVLFLIPMSLFSRQVNDIFGIASDSVLAENMSVLLIIAGSAIAVYLAVLLTIHLLIPAKEDTYITIADTADISATAPVSYAATERITAQQRDAIFRSQNTEVFREALRLVIKDHQQDLEAEEKQKKFDATAEAQKLLSSADHRTESTS